MVTKNFKFTNQDLKNLVTQVATAGASTLIVNKIMNETQLLEISPRSYPVKYDVNKRKYIISYDVKRPDGKRKRGKLKISIKKWQAIINQIINEEESKKFDAEKEPNRVIRL